MHTPRLFHGAKKKGSGRTGALKRKQPQNDCASAASAVSPERGPGVSGSSSARSSFRTTSARMVHETIFVDAAFLPLPFGRS